MNKSILLSEETHRRLMMAKLEMRFKPMDDMLGRIVSEIAKARLLEVSAHFRTGLKRKRPSVGEVSSSGEAIRIELFRSWFGKEKSFLGANVIYSCLHKPEGVRGRVILRGTSSLVSLYSLDFAEEEVRISLQRKMALSK